MEETIRTALVYLDTHREQLAIGAGVLIAGLSGSLALGAFILVRLPEDYLVSEGNKHFLPGRPAWMRFAARMGKNLFGIVLVGVGIVLSLPGIPGPGGLMFWIALMFLDIPGKQRLERRVFGAPKLHGIVTRLRARFGRPPLRV